MQPSSLTSFTRLWFSCLVLLHLNEPFSNKNRTEISSRLVGNDSLLVRFLCFWPRIACHTTEGIEQSRLSPAQSWARTPDMGPSVSWPPAGTQPTCGLGDLPWSLNTARRSCFISENTQNASTAVWRGYQDTKAGFPWHCHLSIKQYEC